MALKRRLLSLAVAAGLLAAGQTAIAATVAAAPVQSGDTVAAGPVDPGCGGCGNGGD